MFYACFTLIGSWEGGKNFRVGIFLNKNLLGKGYRKQTTFFRPKVSNQRSEIHFLGWDEYRHLPRPLGLFSVARVSNVGQHASAIIRGVSEWIKVVRLEIYLSLLTHC